MNDIKRKLIWKYFWKRKRQEIWGFAKNNYPFFFIFIFSILFMGLIISMGYDPNMELLISKILFNIVVGAMLLFMVILIGRLVFLAIKEIVKWLQQNWEWATEDAERELNKRRRNK